MAKKKNVKKSNKIKNNGHLEVSDELRFIMENNTDCDIILNTQSKETNETQKEENNNIADLEQPSMSEQMLESIPEKYKESVIEETARLEELDKQFENFGKPSSDDCDDEELEMPMSLTEYADSIKQERKTKKKLKKAELRKEMGIGETKKEREKKEKQEAREKLLQNETELEREERIKKENKKLKKKKEAHDLETEMTMKQNIRYDMIDNFGKSKKKKKSSEEDHKEILSKNNIDTLSILEVNLKDTKFYLAIKAIKDKYVKLMEEKDNITEEYFDTIILPTSKLLNGLLNQSKETDIVKSFKMLADLMMIDDLFAETMEAELESMVSFKDIDEIFVQSIVENIKFKNENKKAILRNVTDKDHLLGLLKVHIHSLELDSIELCKKLLRTDKKSNINSLDFAFKNNPVIKYDNGEDVAKLLISSHAVGRLSNEELKNNILNTVNCLNSTEKDFVETFDKYFTSYINR